MIAGTGGVALPLPGGDLKPLDLVPVAVRDRLRSSALATRDSSGWHHSRPNIGFGSRSQPETALPSCASCWCASAQASIAPRWTFSQSPSGNVLEAPQSPQVTVRSGMGHSIHPARAVRAERSWRLSPNSPRACPVDHGTGSRSQIRIDARSTVPWYMNWRLS